MGCEQFSSEGCRENALSFHLRQGPHWRSGALGRNLFGPKPFRGWSQIEHEVDARSFVGTLDRTDEFLLLTATGAMKTRCVAVSEMRQQGARNTKVTTVVWLGFDAFRPVHNHIGSWESSHCYVRFGPRRRPSRLAHSQLLLLFFLRPPRWGLELEC